MNTGRKSSGNMLALVCLTMGLIIAAGVGGFIFNSLLFQRTRAQYKVDALALSMASSINVGDRVGRINSLAESSRELVFVSRQHLDDCENAEMAFISPLCDQLLVEARANHALVENERKNQIRLISKEIQDAALKYNDERTPDSTFTLRWMETYEPKITRVDVGRVSNIQSNVRSLGGLPALAEFDRKEGFVENTSHLFKANINAKLPLSDGDLDYKLSSLPALVGKTCAPPRNANPDVFVPAGTVLKNGAAAPASVEFIPDAVRLFCSMDAAVGKDRNKRTSLDINSTGITSGACAE